MSTIGSPTGNPGHSSPQAFFTDLVIYLSVMWVRIKMGKYNDGNYDHIEIAGLFWHFVDLIWILVFTIVYLVPLSP